MKLLVDIGNSFSKAVLSDNGQLTRVDYDLSLFDKHNISQLTYASVGHQDRAAALIVKAQQANAQIIEVTTASEAFGVKCAYAKYQTLGIDRWLAVLGVAHEFPQQNVIVVDAGTATTVDFLRKDKQHRGGWIVPGLDLMTSSVTSQTQKVFDDDSATYTYEIGVSTPMALKSGCLAAQLGLIHQAVNVFDEDAVLVMTGGNAELLLEHVEAVHDPLIVFKGLDRF